MKQKTVYQLLCTISICLSLAFIIYVIMDYTQYDSMTNSAPFYVFLLERSIEFLLPSIILLITAWLYKKKKGIQ